MHHKNELLWFTCLVNGYNYSDMEYALSVAEQWTWRTSCQDLLCCLSLADTNNKLVWDVCPLILNIYTTRTVYYQYQCDRLALEHCSYQLYLRDYNIIHRRMNRSLSILEGHWGTLNYPNLRKWAPGYDKKFLLSDEGLEFLLQKCRDHYFAKMEEEFQRRCVLGILGL